MQRMMGVALALGLAACAQVAGDASPPGPQPAASPWAIERQVALCRQSQAGGTRSVGAGGSGLFIGGSVTAFSRTVTPETEACPAVLELTDQDVVEIRSLVQAVAASGRGLQTNWRTPAGLRRELVLSVYPEQGPDARPCRVVTAELTVLGGPAAALAGGPPPAELDAQKLCRSPARAWEPQA